MVSLFASSMVDGSMGSTSSTGRVKLKTMELIFAAFSTKHTALRSKSKDCLAQNQDNVSEWVDMSDCRLLFKRANTIKILLSLLV